MIAAGYTNLKKVQLLIENGADVNAVSTDKHTALDVLLRHLKIRGSKAVIKDVKDEDLIEIAHYLIDVTRINSYTSSYAENVGNYDLLTKVLKKHNPKKYKYIYKIRFDGGRGDMLPVAQYLTSLEGGDVSIKNQQDALAQIPIHNTTYLLPLREHFDVMSVGRGLTQNRKVTQEVKIYDFNTGQEVYSGADATRGEYGASVIRVKN